MTDPGGMVMVEAKREIASRSFVCANTHHPYDQRTIKRGEIYVLVTFHFCNPSKNVDLGVNSRMHESCVLNLFTGIEIEEDVHEEDGPPWTDSDTLREMRKHVES